MPPTCPDYLQPPSSNDTPKILNYLHHNLLKDHECDRHLSPYNIWLTHLSQLEWYYWKSLSDFSSTCQEVECLRNVSLVQQFFPIRIWRDVIYTECFLDYLDREYDIKYRCLWDRRGRWLWPTINGFCIRRLLQTRGQEEYMIFELLLL